MLLAQRWEAIGRAGEQPLIRTPCPSEHLRALLAEREGHPGRVLRGLEGDRRSRRSSLTVAMNVQASRRRTRPQARRGLERPRHQRPGLVGRATVVSRQLPHGGSGGYPRTYAWYRPRPDLNPVVAPDSWVGLHTGRPCSRSSRRPGLQGGYAVVGSARTHHESRHQVEVGVPRGPRAGGSSGRGRRLSRRRRALERVLALFMPRLGLVAPCANLFPLRGEMHARPARLGDPVLGPHAWGLI